MLPHWGLVTISGTSEAWGTLWTSRQSIAGQIFQYFVNSHGFCQLLRSGYHRHLKLILGDPKAFQRDLHLVLPE